MITIGDKVNIDPVMLDTILAKEFNIKDVFPEDGIVTHLLYSNWLCGNVFIIYFECSSSICPESLLIEVKDY